MTDWVRLWHDMPTDPKWRVIARKSGATISEVIAVFNFVMVNASANANERGRTHNLFAEDIAAALDADEAVVEAILTTMRGKVICPDGSLLGWQKRQPKREDSSAERAKAWREERKRTQANAPERPETETELDNTLAKANAVDVEKVMFDQGVSYLVSAGAKPDRARSMLGKWKSKHGAPAVIEALGAAQRHGAIDPIPFIEGRFTHRAKTYDSDRITV
jgi:hypothetical protein